MAAYKFLKKKEKCFQLILSPLRQIRAKCLTLP